MSTRDALIVRIGCGGVMFGLGGTIKASFPRSMVALSQARVCRRNSRKTKRKVQTEGGGGISATETKRKWGAGHQALVQCPILMPKVG